MKKIKMLNEYLASLEVMTAKLHNLHWNVEGRRFEPIHLLTERIYERLFEEYDEVAERVKMLGHLPLVRLDEFIKFSFIKELDSKAFKDIEVLEILLPDLKLLKEKATIIRDYLDKENDPVSVGIFDKFLTDLDKDIWFVSSMLK